MQRRSSDAPVTPVTAPLPPQHDRRRLLTLTALAALSVIGVTTALWWRPRSGAATPVRLAMLPFADRSGSEQALARGLAQDVARALGQRADVLVVAPDALFDLDRGTEADVVALARRLGVQAVLQGELARSGPLLRVSARLQTTDEAAPVWQQTFEHAARQASALPASIAQQVGAALALAPLPAAASPASAASEAYELYVLGNDAWRPENAGSLRQGAHLFPARPSTPIRRMRATMSVSAGSGSAKPPTAPGSTCRAPWRWPHRCSSAR